MYVRLTQNIYSNFKADKKTNALYGSAGERVKVISDNPDVLIVEGKSGRFPVNRKFIN